MEGMNYLTPADVMLMTKHNGGRGMAATGIGLAAGLGGGALLLAIGLGWGLNQASIARAKASENAAQGNKNAIDTVAQLLLQERGSRESWQNYHAPSIRQYVDVQSTAQQGQQANPSALAYAEASALAQAINNNNSGLNSAVGNCGYLRVQRYSAPQPCGCDTCGA